MIKKIRGRKGKPVHQTISSSKVNRTLSKDGSIHVTDEFYNSLISGFGAFLALIGSYLLISKSIHDHKIWHLIGFSLYGLALFNLFIASALHHGVNASEKIEAMLRRYDYYAIFFMIAGSFTPICLILFRNNLGWSILSLVWICAILGIILQMFFPNLPKWFSTTLYIGIGWLGVLLAKPIYLVMPQILYLLIAGGLFFTVGAIIYFFEKPNLFPGKFGFHEIWHLFVLAGASTHYFIMYFYLLPYPL